MNLPFVLSTPPGSYETPVWDGHAFQVGGRTCRILSYETGSSGWTDELTEMHEAADDDGHYINVASREHAVSEIQRWVKNPVSTIIDIGCSSGYTVALLRERMPHATVIGADFVRGPLEKLGRSVPNLPLLHFNLVKCPLPDASFDGIILLNVLEHIEDDAAAVGQVARILKPGGVAAIEVPAGPGLYDVYDQQLMHFRRYRMSGIIELIRSHNLEIVSRSHLGFLLYPAFFVAKKLGKRQMTASADDQKRAVAQKMRMARHNSFMQWLMGSEARLRRMLYLPFGIRCLVTCRKPQS